MALVAVVLNGLPARTPLWPTSKIPMRCMAIILCLAALGAAAGRCWAAPGEALWSGQVAVESRGNTRAYNSHSGATGIVQIRMAALADVNRIARNMGLAARYTPADRLDPAKARHMWRLYLAYYGACYTEENGRQPSDEVYARIWNGGPTGWKKRDTRGYWGRVKALMPEESAEETPAEGPAAPLPPTPDEAAPANDDAPAPAQGPGGEAAPAAMPAEPASPPADDGPAAATRGALSAIALIIAVSAPVVLRARAAR